MQVFIGRRHVSAAKPDTNGIAFDKNRRVADHFVIPALGSREGAGQLLPDYAIYGSSQAKTAVFGAVAARVQHPILAVRLPDRGLAQAVFIECSIRAEF